MIGGAEITGYGDGAVISDVFEFLKVEASEGGSYFILVAATTCGDISVIKYADAAFMVKAH